MASSLATVSGGRCNHAAFMFSRRCSTDVVPQISRILGERCNNQASATCIGVAASRARVTVLWHQRGVDRRGERLDCEVLGLDEVRDRLLYRAQMFYFDSAAVRKFLQSRDTKWQQP